MARRQLQARRGSMHLQPSASGDARARLAASVLASVDAADAAHTVLRWIGEHAGMESAICAVVDEEQHRLVGIAGDGVPHARVAGLSVDLDSKDDTLVLALGSAQPIYFSGATGRARSRTYTSLDETPFHAIPLQRPEAAGEPAFGLLLISGIDGAPGEDVLWGATLLATKLLSLRYKRARSEEQRLRRERLALMTVVNAVTDPIILSDSDGNMLLANAPAEQLFVADEEVSEGRRRAIALNNMLFSATMFTASEQGARARRELLLVDPSEGRDLLFELLCTTVREPRGETGIVSVLRNVNDLRRASEEIESQYRKLERAEAEVRAERDRLDLIINAVVDPVLVTDPSGSTVLLNPPAERLFTTVGDPDSKSAERHVRANDAVFSSFVSNLYTNQALRWRGELSLVEPGSGKKLAFEAIAGKVIAKQGEDVAVVTILHDRSEAIEKARLYEQVKQHSEELQRRVKEATAELQQQNELLRDQAIALEQASQAKSRFLANMSHELRTPLNAVLGYTDLLGKGVFGQLDPRQTEKLERIDSNARHLLSIINDLLDISRIESGHMVLKNEPFDLGALVDEVMREMEPIIARSRLSVTAELVTAPLPVLTDRQRVKQILVNLVSNAIKFTPEGFVRVRVALDEAADSVTMSVADTGIGIPSDHQRRIFEDFYQVDESDSRRHGGTGLGLAICRRLARHLGGDITLLSRPGAGSTFSVTFPRERREP